jgi:hypothetical protein
LFAERAPGFQQGDDEGPQISVSHDELAHTFFETALSDAGVAEAFAAGYQCAAEEYDAKIDKV